MRDRGGEKIMGDCINAIFQGYFQRDALFQQQNLQGLGIAIDDEFNFMLSHWRTSMLNGDSIIKISSGHVLYGAFQHNLPVGLVAIHREGLKIFLNRVSLKRGGIEWAKEAAVFDDNSNIFYVMELGKKDDQQTTLDMKTSNSQSSRYDRVKLQWKIKIVERCPLKQDGSLAINSKLARRYDKKMDYFKSDFTLREQNQIHLLASTLGGAFYDPAFISIKSFLKRISQNNPRICLQSWRERNEEEEIMLVGLEGGTKNEKKLGLTLSLTYDYIKSLGTYSQDGKLNGLGVQYRKNGQSFVGLFKQNILTKEYKHNTTISKNISTFTTRELATQQHLRSLNYIHNSIYLPQICNITGIASKVSKYIDAFQREFQKRNSNYNETPSCQSISSQTMNIYKYIDLNRQRHEEMFSSRNQIATEHSDREAKKPGFILNKSNNKSVDKSPKPKQISPSPTPKSPLRNVRITGKIYHQTDRHLNNRSPSQHFARLKLSEETYKKDKYY